MRSSKALEALDRIPDDEFERPEAASPVQIDDRAVVKALADVAAAVRDRPEEKEEADYTRALERIASAVGSLAGMDTAIAGMRHEISALTKAVSAIEAMDLKPVVEAINAMSSAQKALSQTLSAPRVLTFDKNGEPSGIRIGG